MTQSKLGLRWSAHSWETAFAEMLSRMVGLEHEADDKIDGNGVRIPRKGGADNGFFITLCVGVTVEAGRGQM
jgi:hypothetical protein